MTQLQKRGSIALLLVLLVVAGAFFVSIQGREPEYGGYPLSAWVMNRGPGPSSSNAVAQIGAKAIPHLVSWLDVEDGWSRRWFRKARQWIFKTNDQQLSAEDRAQFAIIAFSYLGPAKNEAIAPLARLLREGNDTMARAMQALAELGEIAIPTISSALTNSNSDVRCAAAMMFYRFGTNAARGIPDLTKLIQDENPETSLAAIQTLGHIQIYPPGAVDRLIQHLSSTNGHYRYWACIALKQFGVQGRPAVPALKIAMRDSSPGISSTAIDALSRMNVEDAEAIQILLGNLQSADVSDRLQAATFLGQFGTNAVFAVEPLKAAAQDPDSNVREAAEHALRQILPAIDVR